ncbi:MAG: integrase [Rhodobacteraceae bacterium]|nr:integrase [Paracoccaceae bacterium]MBR28561.1 integrase [Paracoccaceae bacterium]
MSGRLHPKSLTTLEKRGLHGDGGGLYLRVGPTGARSWILRIVVQGRRRDLGLGALELVSLKEAREKAQQWRKVAREGRDPAQVFAVLPPVPTFAEAARTVHASHVAASSRNGKHQAQWLSTLEKHAFPLIGDKRVDEVDRSHVLEVLSPIWLAVPETARRVRQRIGAVLDWAYQAGHRDGANPVVTVAKGLPKQPRARGHFAALPWTEVPDLHATLVSAAGMGALALRLVILTAARSGEVRGATWDEIDLEAGVWAIPAERMKAGVAHRVPLSAPALALLTQMVELRDPLSPLVFPSTHRRGRPLSDMTLAAAMKRAGRGHATVHGLRSSFRDWTEEATAYRHEVKEAALAHAVKSKIEGAYRRSDLFDQRRAMMDDWAAFATGGAGKVAALGAAARG